MKAKVFDTGLSAESTHELFAIPVRAFFPFTSRLAPVPMPKNPGLAFITLCMSSQQNLVELSGHVE